MKSSLLSLIAFSILASSQAFAGQLSCFYLEKNGSLVIGANQITATVDSELNVSRLRLTSVGATTWPIDQFKKLELFDIVMNRRVLKMTAVNSNEKDFYYKIEAAYQGEYFYKGTITTTRAPHFNHSYPVECFAVAQD